MEIQYLVGIDFGHGETTVSYVNLQGKDGEQFGRLKLWDTGESDERIYKRGSAVYRLPKHTTDRYVFPEYDYSLNRVLGSGVCHSFKAKISDLNKPQNREKKEAFANFIRLIYEEILNNNDILKRDGSNFFLYIASPTEWSDQEKDEYRKFVEKSLGRRIGWVINESDAAYYAKKQQDGLVLVVDYGSSTIDFTLMYNNKKINIDKFSAPLGGQSVEIDLLNLYEGEFKSDYHSKEKVALNNMRETDNMHLDIRDEILFSLRRTKENLYSFSDSKSLSGFEWDFRYNWILMKKPIKRENDFRMELDKDEKEFLGGYMQLVKHCFETVKRQIDDSVELQELGVDSSKLEIILSGGASRMPWVRESLSQVFGIKDDKLKLKKDSDPEYIVSDGIAKYAYALYRVRTKIAEELLKFNFWLSEQDGMLSELISKVCREACLKRMENDPEIKNYRSEQFTDGTVEDKIPENPFKNYFKSSIKGLVMDIIAPINKVIWDNRVSINKEISEDLKREICKVLDDRFRDSFSTLFRVASDQINLAGNQNGLVLPPITSDFTIGMDKLKEIADHCMDAKGKWNVNTLYGDGFLQKGSYRKERDSDNRKKIADVYFEYIRQQIFEPYPLDVVKERIFGYAVDTIVEAVEHYLAFNPCGYDLAEEIKRELKIETINVCDSPTTQK